MNEKREIKTYRSIDEMVEYLYKSKKIIVDDEDKHYFSERNYISMINPLQAIFFNRQKQQRKINTKRTQLQRTYKYNKN